jgi:phosphomevalonate kinase
LPFAAVRAGGPADSRSLVGAVRQAGRDGGPTAACIDHLVELAGRAARALARRDIPELRSLLQAYGVALLSLGDAAGVDIVSGPHREIARIAGSLGAIYKTSGAGGGDIGIVFADTPSTLDRLSRRLGEQGSKVLPLTSAREGLRVDR